MTEQTFVCLRTGTDPSLQAYLDVGGYAQFKRIVTDKVKATDIISQVKLSGLRGRGGAGFAGSRSMAAYYVA